MSLKRAARRDTSSLPRGVDPPAEVLGQRDVLGGALQPAQRLGGAAGDQAAEERGAGDAAGGHEQQDEPHATQQRARLAHGARDLDRAAAGQRRDEQPHGLAVELRVGHCGAAPAGRDLARAVVHGGAAAPRSPTPVPSGATSPS